MVDTVTMATPYGTWLEKESCAEIEKEVSKKDSGLSSESTEKEESHG